MTAIIPFLKNDCAFEQHDITSMSMALADVCKELKIVATRGAKPDKTARSRAGRGKRRDRLLVPATRLPASPSKASCVRSALPRKSPRCR
jgi:hypothetical protein